MGNRGRSRENKGWISGLYTWNPLFPPVEGEAYFYSPQETCQDTVGWPEKDNPFSLYQYWSRVGRLFGKFYSGGQLIRECENWPAGYNNLSADPRVQYPALTSNELQNFALETVAKTNPTRSSVNIPTMIGELRDLPYLVRGWGRSLLGKIAAGNLTWRFGVRPMISDAKKLLQYTHEVNNLLRAMQKLQSDGSISRRCLLATSGPDEFLVYDGVYNTTAFYFLNCQRYLTYTAKVWGSCRWKLAADFEPPPPNADLEEEMRRLVLGLSVEGAVATVWELIPWSWLVDWFIDIQSFLGTINSLPLEHEGICIMRTSSAKSRYVIDTTPNRYYNTDCRIAGRSWELGVRKERWPIGHLVGVPTASIPALSVGQWSILTSLVVLRTSH